MSFDNRSSTREGNGGNSDMESQPPSLCKAGCGFYGNPASEGLCSVCHKDKMKRQMQSMPSSSSPVPSHSSPSLNNAILSVEENVTEALTDSSSTHHIANAETDAVEARSTTPNVGTGVSTTTLSGASDLDSSANASSTPDASRSAQAQIDKLEIASSPTDASDIKDAEASAAEKPKKNRCLTCKKKVGLTGFQCRCNGLFCTTHRYSDMHDCPFNYKELGQEQIRKNNPVVVGQKITKI